MATGPTNPNAFPGPYGGLPDQSSLFVNYSAANAGTQIKTGIGSFRRVVVNTGVAAATITLYDGTSSGGTVIASISTATQTDLEYGVQFNTGLFAVVVGTANVTVVYS